MSSAAMERSGERQVETFIRDGVVRIEGAFSHDTAEACRAILWRDLGLDAGDPSTWTKPVVRLGQYFDPLFVDAANAPVLHEAYDRLVGRGRWRRPASVGTFPVRFPSPDDPGDVGWHVDASFAPPNGDAQDYAAWRVNACSKGRALLMLFLFSDVGPDDAPTRIRVGSHLGMARALRAFGEEGVSVFDLQNAYAASEGLPEITATGRAGTVYLCHPFLIHSAQPHRGRTPRFMAQPPLFPAEPLMSYRDDGDYSAVERAIRLGWNMERA